MDNLLGISDAQHTQDQCAAIVYTQPRCNHPPTEGGFCTHCSSSLACKASVAKQHMMPYPIDQYTRQLPCFCRALPPTLPSRRVVVCKGGVLGAQPPAAGAGTATATPDKQQQQPPTAAQPGTSPVQRQISLEATPSMTLAAGAGTIPPSLLRNYSSSSLRPVGEDRVLSPEATEQPPADPAGQAQQQNSRPSGLQHSESMLLAAAVGAVPPPGATSSTGFVLYSNSSSRDSSPQHQRPRSSNSGDATTEMYRQAQVSAASAATGSTADTGSTNGQPPAAADASGSTTSTTTSTLRLSPSMVWAAGAGVLSVAALPDSSTPTAATDGAAAAAGFGLGASPLQQHLQRSGSFTRSPGNGGVPLAGLPSRSPQQLPRAGSSQHRGVSVFALNPVAMASAAAAAAQSGAVELSIGLTKATMAFPCFADMVGSFSGRQGII